MSQNPGLQSLREIDDKDTRFEILLILEKLTVEQRVGFLQWAATTANNRMLTNNRVIITSTTGQAYETFADLCLMHSQYGLPLQTILKGLEAVARFPERLHEILLSL